MTLNVKKPKSFMHEGDIFGVGINGLDFGGAGTQATFEYTVIHCDDLISSGSIYYNLGVTANRKTMKAISPAQGEFVTGANVEFKWDMDYRNEGARLSIYNRGAGGNQRRYSRLRRFDKLSCPPWFRNKRKGTTIRRFHRM